MPDVDRKIVLIEDEPIIAWDMKHKIESVSPHQVVVYESYHDCISPPLEKNPTVFCNLRLIEGWITQEKFDDIVSYADKFVLCTGLSDTSYHFDHTHSDTHVLLKPFTMHQLKKLLDIL